MLAEWGTLDRATLSKVLGDCDNEINALIAKRKVQETPEGLALCQTTLSSLGQQNTESRQLPLWT